MENNKKKHIEEFWPDALFCVGHDNAIIGIADTFHRNDIVLYDTDIIIKNLMEEGMSNEEAIEYFRFNIVGSYVGEQTPIYATIIKE